MLFKLVLVTRDFFIDGSPLVQHTIVLQIISKTILIHTPIHIYIYAVKHVENGIQYIIYHLSRTSSRHHHQVFPRRQQEHPH